MTFTGKYTVYIKGVMSENAFPFASETVGGKVQICDIELMMAIKD